MGIITSSINGHYVTSARVTIPQWGCWFADVTVDGDVRLATRVSLQVADLSLSGSVVSGGLDGGRSYYRIVAGSGGWGKSISARSYANDAGVKLSTIVSDAANDCGELVDGWPSDSVGSAFVRAEAPASSVLELLARGSWYVDSAGITRHGMRPSRRLDEPSARGVFDRARNRVTLALDSIAEVVPGVTYDGMQSADIEHELSDGGLRTTLWGSGITHGSRAAAAMRAIVDSVDPDRAYRGLTEYRVVTLEGDCVNLQPVLRSAGMPDLRRVPIRPSVGGGKSTLQPGARVLVSFVNSDPARPFVLAFEEYGGPGFRPLTFELDAQTLVRLGAGIKPVVAAGDFAGPFPCTPTQTKVMV